MFKAKRILHLRWGWVLLIANSGHQKPLQLTLLSKKPERQREQFHLFSWNKDLRNYTQVVAPNATKVPEHSTKVWWVQTIRFSFWKLVSAYSGEASPSAAGVSVGTKATNRHLEKQLGSLEHLFESLGCFFLSSV